MAKLGDVFTLIRNGASIKQTEGAGGFPITRIETIANREVDRNKFGYANIVDIAKYESYILQDGDILMSHINSEKHLGKVALYKKQANEQIIHGMNLLLLRANPKILLPAYAAYYFETPAFLWQVQRITKKSVNQASFTVTALKEVEIPLPSLDTQRRIAAILDKVTDLIAQRRAQLDKLDLLVKSRFVEMFGEENKYTTAEKACNTIVDCPHSTPRYTGQDKIYPSIRTSEIKNGQIDWTTMLYVDIEEYESRTKRLKPMPGDIVYAREGTYGDCVILPEHHKFCLGQRTMLFRPDYSICTSEYLHQALRSNAVKRQADESNAGSTVPHVNVADAKKFTFPLPPLAKQKTFSVTMQKTNQIKNHINRSLEWLEVLKKSLMQQYFE